MRALLAVLATLGLLVGTAPAASAGLSAAEVCVTIYENVNGWNGGDAWTKCGTIPGTLGDSNLTGDTSGLHNGCESQASYPFTNPDWNDCASSIRYSNLPANYRVNFYINSNYGISNHCWDANGTLNANFSGAENDRTSSWRVEGGNC